MERAVKLLDPLADHPNGGYHTRTHPFLRKALECNETRDVYTVQCGSRLRTEANKWHEDEELARGGGQGSDLDEIAAFSLPLGDENAPDHR